MEGGVVTRTRHCSRDTVCRMIFMFHRPRMTSLCSPSDGADTTWLGLGLGLVLGLGLGLGLVLDVLASAHRVRQVFVACHLCLLLRAGGV